MSMTLTKLGPSIVTAETIERATDPEARAEQLAAQLARRFDRTKDTQETRAALACAVDTANAELADMGVEWSDGEACAWRVVIVDCGSGSIGFGYGLAPIGPRDARFGGTDNTKETDHA